MHTQIAVVDRDWCFQRLLKKEYLKMNNRRSFLTMFVGLVSGIGLSFKRSTKHVLKINGVEIPEKTLIHLGMAPTSGHLVERYVRNGKIETRITSFKEIVNEYDTNIRPEYIDYEFSKDKDVKQAIRFYLDKRSKFGDEYIAKRNITSREEKWNVFRRVYAGEFDDQIL